MTICHRHTKNLEHYTTQADILIVATGVPKLIGKNHTKEGQVIIDVGITSVVDDQGNRKLQGDVDEAAVLPHVQALTPVPGGVGPMTVASLFENLFEASTRFV